MQATATTNQREQNEQARMRALVRFNGLTFHSLAAASFLETAVPLQVNRLARPFGDRPDARLWLEQVWWPQRAELGRRLREYVVATWPEFDWEEGYQDFCERYRPGSGLEGRRGGATAEVLGQCATAAQAALFYRSLAGGADEPALRELARMAAADHAGYFDFFRMLFERCRESERVGPVATWRTLAVVCRSARDHDVAAAFDALGRNWKIAPIVPLLGYPEYRLRMAQLIRRHAAPGPIQRLLFRPWLVREGATPSAQPQLQPAAGESGHWPRMAAQAA
jgi:hypothetical protein